jgi:PAS domain S-box-containing protein
MEKANKILLVDDEERFATSLLRILTFYGYNTSTALSGNSAVHVLKKETFDVVLLDVNLPDINGCEILDFVVSSNIRTTVVMLTGLSTVELAVRAMKLGAYDFLNKPINHDQLLKTIDKAIQHQNLKKELASSEMKFKALSGACTEGVVIHDNGIIADANNQFFQLFGYTKADLASGIRYTDLLSGHSHRTLHNDKGSLFDRYELYCLRKNGTTFPAEACCKIVHIMNRPWTICTFKDLTERITIEKERLDLQKRIGKIDKLQSLGMMAGAVAHDLNNILVGVVSFPETLLCQIDPNDKLYAGIKQIQEAGKRAAAVVADLLLLARGGNLATTIGNLNEIVITHLQSIEFQVLQSRHPGVLVKTDLRGNLHNVKCSFPHIHKILLNLINNALEASDPEGSILVSTSNCMYCPPDTTAGAATEASEYVLLSVTDSGPGIPDSDIERIFDPFFTTKESGKSGTGLGLSIVWNVIRQHNGWIEAKNTGHGASFKVYLPAAVNAPETSSLESILKLQPGKGEKILLVDDQESQNQVLSLMLNKLGYTTHSVTSGEESIEYLRQRSVDLVMLDMKMGNGLNGRETYEKILQIHPHQKGIILSGYSDSDEIKLAKDLGISFFLEKPVTMAVLSAALHYVLKNSMKRVEHYR